VNIESEIFFVLFLRLLSYTIRFGGELLIYLWLLIVLVALFALLLAPPVFYFVWIKDVSKKTWMLKVNSDYVPAVTLIVSTFNEALVIGKKLTNIQEMNYPVDKLEVIIVDSASTDNTLSICSDFLKSSHFRFPIRLVSEEKRLGKSHALNTALGYATGEIIATSDADAMWEPNALKIGVSFFSDESVGAVTGKEKFVNLEESVHTQSEGLYRNFYYTLRLGESKIHSTLIFQGELALYRRIILGRFEDKPGYSDDIGTVINIVSNGYRCLFIPEAIFYDTAAFSLKGRLMLKSRRAEHLIAGVVRSFRLKIEKKLPLSWPVVSFNFYLHVVSPFLLIAALLTTAVVYVVNFRFVWFLGFFIVILLILKKPRIFAFSYLTSNLALIMGLYYYVTKKRSSVWPKIDEMRLKS
jgi:poly-beta-1,6-N-acetyl-D-glucosamine synthase